MGYIQEIRPIRAPRGPPREQHSRLRLMACRVRDSSGNDWHYITEYPVGSGSFGANGIPLCLRAEHLRLGHQSITFEVKGTPLPVDYQGFIGIYLFCFGYSLLLG